VAKALADGVRDFADRVLSRRLFAQVREPPQDPQPAPATPVAPAPPAAQAPAAVNAGGLVAPVASPGGTR
jgi:hypothetical protein